MAFSSVSTLCILALVVFTTAFSLERSVTKQRVSGSHLSKVSPSLSTSPLRQSSKTALKSTSSDAVLVAENSEKKGLFSIFGNQQVKLFFYLTVWYLGNVYCKSLPFLIALVLKPLLFR